MSELMVYRVVNTTTGRIRTFDAASWSDVERQLIALGLDPDNWAIDSID